MHLVGQAGRSHRLWSALAALAIWLSAASDVRVEDVMRVAGGRCAVVLPAAHRRPRLLPQNGRCQSRHQAGEHPPGRQPQAPGEDHRFWLLQKRQRELAKIKSWHPRLHRCTPRICASHTLQAKGRAYDAWDSMPNQLPPFPQQEGGHTKLATHQLTPISSCHHHAVYTQLPQWASQSPSASSRSCKAHQAAVDLLSI